LGEAWFKGEAAQNAVLTCRRCVTRKSHSPVEKKLGILSELLKMPDGLLSAALSSLMIVPVPQPR